MTESEVKDNIKILDKRFILETGEKTHLYQIKERFFNIWYLMRQGRANDKGKVIWLVKFFEKWFTKDSLKKWTDSYLKELETGNYDPQTAFYNAVAAIRSGHLSSSEIKPILFKIRFFFIKGNNILYIRSIDSVFEDIETNTPKAYILKWLSMLENADFFLKLLMILLKLPHLICLHLLMVF